jgi:uncharacterized cupredoxin-like copper-binding protein
MKSFNRVCVIAGLATLGLALSACGADGNDESGSVVASGDASADGVIEIAMVDIAVEAVAVEVKAGEPVTFKFTNNGKIKHEAIFGDEAEQEAHGEEMANMGDEQMDMNGDGTMDMSTSDMAGTDGEEMDNDFVLEPGESGEITMTFDEAGTTIIGCHETGHWEAGMRVDVTITA